MASTAGGTATMTGMSKDELRILITNNINTLHDWLNPRVREVDRPGLLTLKNATLEALTILGNKFINDLHALDENRKTEVRDEVERRNGLYNRFQRKRDKKRIWKYRYMQIGDACIRSEEALLTTFKRRILALKLRIAGLQIELNNRPINIIERRPKVTWLMLH